MLKTFTFYRLQFITFRMRYKVDIYYHSEYLLKSTTIVCDNLDGKINGWYVYDLIMLNNMTFFFFFFLRVLFSLHVRYNSRRK